MKTILIERLRSVLLAIALGSTGAGSSIAQGAETDVTLLAVTTNIEATMLPYGVLAIQKGWFRDEGLNVRLETAPTMGQAMQLLLADKVDIAMMHPDEMILAADGPENKIKFFYPLVRKQVFGALVRADSEIQSYCDMDKKNVAFPAFSASMLAYVERRMEECKTPGMSINRVESGYGVSSAHALESRSVDAFVGWTTLFATYEAAGYDFRRLAPASWQVDYYGIGYSASDAYVQSNPDVLEKFSRVLVKSALYTRAFPEEAIRALWAAYPEKAPKSPADEGTRMKRDLAILNEVIDMMRLNEFPPEFKWGQQDRATWQRHIDSLKASGQLKADTLPDPDTFFTNQFIEKANDVPRDPDKLK